MKHATIPVSDTPKTPMGVYIHVPFCNEKCPYCDFYSLTRSFDRMDAYTQAVIRPSIPTPPSIYWRIPYTLAEAPQAYWGQNGWEES